MLREDNLFRNAGHHWYRKIAQHQGRQLEIAVCKVSYAYAAYGSGKRTLHKKCWIRGRAGTD
jgi:hypothetical protein